MQERAKPHSTVTELAGRGMVAALFVVQVIHLTWLTTDVVLPRLSIETTVFEGILPVLLPLADYTEIPALIGGSLLYLSKIGRGFTRRDALFLLLINSQWLHLFWITDEFVVEHLTGDRHATILPVWLAWLAIAIDYLEIPVIIDTTRDFFRRLKERIAAQER